MMGHRAKSRSTEDSDSNSPLCGSQSDQTPLLAAFLKVILETHSDVPISIMESEVVLFFEVCFHSLLAHYVLSSSSFSVFWLV